ncbi:hypothetical protein G9A89_005054 [Geosiphon pyriformis]|nr:hypothetical protein G9A89_005054 [Geosiphon pyriformis]
MVSIGLGGLLNVHLNSLYKQANRDCWEFKIKEMNNANELHLVVNSLPNDKAAGLFGIPNELWKCSGEEVMGCLLELLNICLMVGNVPVL